MKRGIAVNDALFPVKGMISVVDEQQKSEIRCPNCGGTDSQWGWVHPVGQQRTVKYTPASKSTMLGFAGTDVKARRSTKCGHLELFATGAKGEGLA